MVSLAMRRLLIGATAVSAALGWLQLAPAFGFPVTAPAAMLDRTLGAHREAGLVGWALLLLGMTGIVAFYLLVVEGRTRASWAPWAYAIGAWLLSGAVLMPLIGLVQGSPPASDPMRATFFMLNLGPAAAVESLVGWLLFGTVLAGGRSLPVRGLAVLVTLGVAALGVVLALALPALAVRSGPDRVVEGPVAKLPAGPVFISVIELPQPPGAVLGPHAHIPGFEFDVFGTAAVVAGGKVLDVGPGDAAFTPANQRHSHENRDAVPYAIALAVLLVGLTAAMLVPAFRSHGVRLLAALLLVSAVATVDPLMNDWYFAGVRPAAARGGLMLVPAAHRTFESGNLTGLGSGPYTERLTTRTLLSGDSARVTGPAAVLVLHGNAGITTGGRIAEGSGTTIAGGVEAKLEAGAGGARVLIIEVLAAGT
jgi:quercetin dioxygenase-like cupin family protein